MDAVQRAGNGHPGTAMSLAPAAYLLFQRFLRHDPADPSSRTPRPHRIRVPLPVASADNLNFLLLAKHTLHTQAKQANQHHDIHTLRTDAQTGEKHPTHTRQGP
jgi:hypothetical protein